MPENQQNSRAADYSNSIAGCQRRRRSACAIT
jgi:hypothetical protein